MSSHQLANTVGWLCLLAAALCSAATIAINTSDAPLTRSRRLARSNATKTGVLLAAVGLALVWNF